MPWEPKDALRHTKKAMLSETQLAYLAGIIDGEGTIGIVRFTSKQKLASGEVKSYTRTEARLTIYNCNVAMMDWLERHLGGKRRLVPRSKENWKPNYSWETHSVKASRLLKAVYPYLVAKAEQADLVMRYQSTKKRVGRKGTPQETISGREEMISRLHVLNRRGKDAVVAA
jgi:hypothetical protein